MTVPGATSVPTCNTGPRPQLGPLTRVIAANVLFGTGLFFHAFLYNFYLEALGLPETVMGNAAGALTLGGLAALLPAGSLTDRVGVRAALVAAAVTLTTGLIAGALVEQSIAVYGAAVLAGAGSGAWRVAVPPVLMRLAQPAMRPRAFGWNVGLLVASGGLGMAVAGAVPDWFESAFHLNRFAAIRAALLIGAAATGLSIPLFARVPHVAVASAGARGASLAERLKGDAVSPRIILLVTLVGIWMLGPALAAPFLNIFFTRRFGLPVVEVGVIFAIAHLLWGAAVFASGSLAARVGVSRLLRVALLVFPPAMLGLSMASGVRAAVTLYVVQGLVSPLTNPLIDQILLSRAPPERRGLVSGWRNAAADLSALAGASAGGILLAATPFAGLLGTAAVVGAIGAVGLLYALGGVPPVRVDARQAGLPAGGADDAM